MAIAVVQHPPQFSKKSIFHIPLWRRCAERLSASKYIKRVYILGEEEAEGFVKEEKGWLKRLLCSSGAGEVVRIWDAQIFIEPHFLDEVITLHRKSKADYTYTVGFPQGLFVGVFSTSLLLELLRSFDDEFFDPFTYIDENKHLFKTKRFYAPLRLWRPSLKLFVYTEEERKEAEELLKKYPSFDTATYIKEEVDAPLIKRIREQIKEKFRINAERVLILCTASLHLVHCVTEAAHTLWKKAEIHILCPKHLSPILSAQKRASKIFTIPEERVTANLPNSLLKEIPGYDVVLLPLQSRWTDEHEDIECLVTNLCRGHVITISPEGRLFFLIKAFEDTEAEHIVVLGARRREKVAGGLQERINKLKRMGQILVLPHPSWISPHILKNLKGFDALEIITLFDPEPPVSSKFSLKYWDYLLGKGVQVWGIAADDSHSLKGKKDAWINVKSKHFTSTSILSSIRRGSFYSSTGPVIKKVCVRDGGVYVRLEEEALVRYIIGGSIRKEVFGKEAFYKVRGDEVYVRFEVLKGEKCGWSQPFFVKSAKHIQSPYAEEGFWFRGNTHCHSARSDGEGSTDAVADSYLERGYNFVAITDHEII